jgi:hypothetical protein
MKLKVRREDRRNDQQLGSDPHQEDSNKIGFVSYHR